MSSVEVYIVAEGQTEQTFVRDVLAPVMSHQGIYLHSALIGKPGHKGGDIRFYRAIIYIGNFLKQRPDTYISTMFDYFRIDSAWPGHQYQFPLQLCHEPSPEINPKDSWPPQAHYY